ncbi:TIP41-like protein [Rhizoctonia solani AG-1 IB]|uniref:TIP41-like protein n=1 Tax=Thanatephorus cucumeris (strain AG1-IB / isolate 7/3/14) TaxID=1108050 RepID=M5BPB8_THACB|nr:TIP41-like protein [Rhizoctonia solani AG-1 IB]
MDDDSSYVEMIDRYPGPDPAALYLSDSMMASPPPSRPTASTQAPSMPYVLHSACLNQSFAASFSSPQNNIMLFDKNTLAAIRTLSGHTDGITSLKSVDVLAGATRRGLISSGKDGRIRIWDERQGGAGAFTAAGAELGVDPQAPVPSEAGKHCTYFCLSPTHIIKYLELDAPIIFWDLEFHPMLGNGAPGGLLLSSSADGLLAITSADEPNEDDAVLSVGNWNTSVARVGWTVRREEILANDPMNFKIWAASDMQTLSVWSEELGIEHDYGDLRRTKIPGSWESDYLINAQWFGYTHTVPWSTNALGLWCGNNKGDIGLISVQDTLSWRLDRVLAGGHTGVVRTCTWDPESQMLITGGEDARLNVWPTSTGDSPVTPHPVAASPVYSQHSNQGYYPPPPGSAEPRPPSVAPSMSTVQSPPMSAMTVDNCQILCLAVRWYLNSSENRLYLETFGIPRMATGCNAAVAVPPHKRSDTETTSTIEISGWRLTSTSLPISNGAEIDACQAEVGINLPEMFFGNNSLVLEWFGPDSDVGTPPTRPDSEENVNDIDIEPDRQPLWRYEFRAQDALKCVHRGPSEPGDGCVKVGYSEAWLKSRTGPAAESPMPEMVEVKPYDWTYTPLYPGHTSLPNNMDNGGFVAANPENPQHAIPIAELQRPDPILFYAEIPLYEDELHDNGLSILTIRIRVMPGSLFILFRFTLRVDDVLFRNFDTRIYHSFISIPNPEDLSPLTDPQWIARMLASLPESSTMDKSSRRSTGWRGLGTRIEVLDLNKLNKMDGELSSGINALRLDENKFEPV